MIRSMHVLTCCYETRIRTEVIKAMGEEANKHAGDACGTACPRRGFCLSLSSHSPVVVIIIIIGL